MYLVTPLLMDICFTIILHILIQNYVTLCISFSVVLNSFEDGVGYK